MAVVIADFVTDFSDRRGAVLLAVYRGYGAMLVCHGSLGLLLDGQLAGSVQMDGDGGYEMIFEEARQPERVREPVLEFAEPEEWKVIKVTLYD